MTQHVIHSAAPLLNGRSQRARLGYRLRTFASARSTLAFLLVVPLLALIGGFVVYPFFYAI